APSPAPSLVSIAQRNVGYVSIDRNRTQRCVGRMGWVPVLRWENGAGGGDSGWVRRMRRSCSAAVVHRDGVAGRVQESEGCPERRRLRRTQNLDLCADELLVQALRVRTVHPQCDAFTMAFPFVQVRSGRRGADGE